MKFMKHTLLLIFLLSCSGPNLKPPVLHIKKTASMYGLNFVPYSKKGFLFTPYSYTQKYKSIGLVSFYIYTSATLYLKKSDSTKLKKATHELIQKLKRENHPPTFRYVWLKDDIENDDILKLAFFESVKLGANALVDLQLEDVKENFDDGHSSTSIPGIKLSGFAIQREDYPILEDTNEEYLKLKKKFNF